MRKSRFHVTFALGLLAAGACSGNSGREFDDNNPTVSAGSGGVAPSTAGMSGAGSPAGTSGGTSAGSGVAGATPTAGAQAAAGAGGSGGANAAGASTGGGGQSSAGSGGGPAREVKASAGCARQSTQVTIPNSLTAQPTGYDGKTPVPAVMAFHAAGNDNTQLQNAFKNSDLPKTYFMVYPGSSGNGWNMQADRSRYLDAYEALLSQACVDENRIYATGHSSGAQMIVQLLCNGDAKFAGVAPIASSVYCQEWENGPVPALIIHGVQDTERQAYGLNDGDGKKDLQPYLTSNGCEMTSTPFDPVLSSCNIQNGVDGKPFNDGCVEFSGCSAKTRWCNHNDPQYGTSNHGIPCFGAKAIYDFFESL